MMARDSMTTERKRETMNKECASDTVWQDCDLVGHEEGCYMLVCPDCGHKDRDCENPNGR